MEWVTPGLPRMSRRQTHATFVGSGAFRVEQVVGLKFFVVLIK